VFGHADPRLNVIARLFVKSHGSEIGLYDLQIHLDAAELREAALSFDKQLLTNAATAM